MSGTWAAGWVTGDIVLAAEFAKGVGCIADSTLTGSAASIDLTGLPTSYAHLVIELYLRTDQAVATSTASIRLNNDSAANYDYQQLDATAASVAAAETFAATSVVAASCPGASAGANLFSAIRITIPHYAGTANNKSLTCVYSHKDGTGSGAMRVGIRGGFWRSSAAVSRVTIIPGGSNFVTGSRVSVYAEGA